MIQNSTFLHFLTLMLYREKSRHIGVVAISVIIIFLLSSVLFISSSIQNSIKITLSNQADFTITKIQGLKSVNTPTKWIDKISTIDGISDINPRVYGRYQFNPKGKSFLIIGIDFFDEVNQKDLKSILGNIDLKDFFKDDNMLVGDGVKNFMSSHFYKDSFSFKTPNGKFKNIKIYNNISSDTNLISNDMVIMPIELAQEIFGMGEDRVSDISFNVVNNSEWDTILTKLHLMFYDIRVMSKDDISKAYSSLYNYKGGLFLVLYLITIVTFMLILYQRYSMVFSLEKRDIGVLRAIGWSIKDVLRVKFYETLIVVLISYILGIVLSYIYVFILNAPILSQIFLGGGNLENIVNFSPILEFGTLSSIFILYSIPFFASVLIPVWKVAITSPKEAML